MNEIKALDINSLSLLSKEEIKEFITHAEEMMKSSSENQIEIPLKNYFSKGVYAREIFIPKGSFAVGKIHKHENLNILSSGEISILSIEGFKRIKAPFTVVSPPGVKRFAYAHEDCVWTTIHGTNETDVEIIETEFIAKDYDEVIEKNEIKNLNDGGKLWLG